MNSLSCASLKYRSWRKIVRSTVEKLKCCFAGGSDLVGFINTGARGATGAGSAPVEEADTLTTNRGVEGDSGIPE